MNESLGFELELQQLEGYEFKVKFDGAAVAPLLLDEPPPLGGGRGPNAARLIAAGVANCLSASLLFCLAGKFKQPLGKVRTRVHAEMVRNDKGRVRIGRFDVTIQLSDDASSLQHFDRCLAQFEDFCIVTQSVRQGIAVGVQVVDRHGVQVFAA